ncbi:MAG: chlorite dismutase family protein [Conexivisphaerales archaeon]
MESKTSGVKYYKYNFYKVVREWRFVQKEQREKHKEEFLQKIKENLQRMEMSFFSLVGLRRDVDFMILARSDNVDKFQGLHASLISTELGKYLEMPYSYLSLTRKSPYLGTHRHEDQEGLSRAEFQSNSKYLFVYPFIKKRSWYKLSFEERQKMMVEHFRIGHKYPKIRINTGYSFGLDDQEFVLAFEGDDPYEFLCLVEELRSSDASAYTEVETPIFTCRRTTPEGMLDILV